MFGTAGAGVPSAALRKRNPRKVTKVANSGASSTSLADWGPINAMYLWHFRVVGANFGYSKGPIGPKSMPECYLAPPDSQLLSLFGSFVYADAIEGLFDGC